MPQRNEELSRDAGSREASSKDIGALDTAVTLHETQRRWIGKVLTG